MEIILKGVRSLCGIKTSGVSRQETLEVTFADERFMSSLSDSNNIVIYGVSRRDTMVQFSVMQVVLLENLVYPAG